MLPKIKCERRAFRDHFILRQRFIFQGRFILRLYVLLPCVKTRKPCSLDCLCGIMFAVFEREDELRPLHVMKLLLRIADATQVYVVGCAKINHDFIMRR
jgi:hypothetical protein